MQDKSIDPMAKRKKICIGIFVGIMVVMMICIFSIFLWLYAEYFKYSSNKQACLNDLLNAQIAYDEKCRELDADLEKIKQHYDSLAKGFKDDYIAKTNELSEAIVAEEAKLQKLSSISLELESLESQYLSLSNAMIRAEQARDIALEQEREAQDSFNEWNGNLGKTKTEVNQLLAKKKSLSTDLAKLQTVTNTVTVNLAVVNNRLKTTKAELASVSNSILVATSSLSDLQESLNKVKQQIKVDENSRDLAQKDCRLAEEALEKAKLELSIIENNKEKIKREIEVLQTSHIQYLGISNKIDLAIVRLNQLDVKISNAKAQKESLELEVDELKSEKNVALDNKRDAESKRDKAIAEKELAEKQLEESKKEKQDLVDTLEQRLLAIETKLNNASNVADQISNGKEEIEKE